MIIDLLINSFGQPKYNADGKTSFAFNCPNCAEENNDKPDGKYNLEINLAKRINGRVSKIYHCWKCDMSGNIKNLLYKFGTKRDYDIYNKNDLENMFFKPSEAKKYKIKLPNEYIPLIDYQKKEYIDYLSGRKISDNIIKFLKIGYCDSGYYEGRLVFPSFNKNNELNYFVTRSIDDKSLKKYDNPNIEKQNIIVNESNINWNHPVTLVEGYFDLTAIPANTIPLLGKVPSLTLINKLRKNKTPVIIALDPDAEKFANEIKELLNYNNIKVIKNVKLVDGDPNEIFIKFGKDKLMEKIIKN